MRRSNSPSASGCEGVTIAPWSTRKIPSMSPSFRAAHWNEGDIDGIFLVLHGAMVTPSHPDAEGELLRRIREIPALRHAPLAAVLDLHANATAEMARHASALVGYR